MASSVTIELIVDSKGAVKSIKSVDGAVVNLTQTVEKEGQNFGRVMDTAYGFALASFALRAAQALMDVVPAIYELGTAAEGTAKRFKAAFGESADSIDAFLNSWANVAGLTVTEGRDMAASMNSIFRGAGFVKDAAADMSVAVLRLVGDMHSFNDVPVAEALDAVKKGLTGNSRAMLDFDVKITAAEVRMKAAEMTGKKLNDVFSEGEKVAARFALMVERQNGKLGHLMENQDSAANSTQRTFAQLQERAEQMAVALLPVLASLANAASEFLSNNEEAITTMIEGIGAALVFTAKVVGDFIGTMADITKLVQDNSTVVFTAAGAFALYAGAVTSASIAQGIFNFAVKNNKLVILISSLLAI
ncbi:MAG TPA: hypothetical protein VKA63_07155, partial [Candidatus Krumholzibacteria bacterium]|nr:hypothetical protein [Candidatus Krumholzibacteria bacterium]